MAKVGDDVAMDIADYLIAEGYGVVTVAQATALEEAADAIETQSGSQWWTKKDFTFWLYRRAYEIFPGRASL